MAAPAPLPIDRARAAIVDAVFEHRRFSRAFTYRFTFLPTAECLRT